MRQNTSSSASLPILILHLTIVCLKLLHFSSALVARLVDTISSQRLRDLFIDVLVSL